MLDDNPAILGQTICGVPVIGPVADAQMMTAMVVVGIASSRNRLVKRQIVERLGVEAARYATLVHPTASVSSRASIGEGSVLLHNVIVGPQVHLGRHVLICAATTIGHDAVVGDYVSMAPQVALSGGVVIGECAYVGAGVRVREGLTVGESSLVGIGSIVLADVEPGCTVLGNPARRWF